MFRRLGPFRIILKDPLAENFEPLALVCFAEFNVEKGNRFVNSGHGPLRFGQTLWFTTMAAKTNIFPIENQSKL